MGHVIAGGPLDNHPAEVCPSGQFAKRRLTRLMVIQILGREKYQRLGKGPINVPITRILSRIQELSVPVYLPPNHVEVLRGCGGIGHHDVPVLLCIGLQPGGHHGAPVRPRDALLVIPAELVHYLR